ERPGNSGDVRSYRPERRPPASDSRYQDSPVVLSDATQPCPRHRIPPPTPPCHPERRDAAPEPKDLSCSERWSPATDSRDQASLVILSAARVACEVEGSLALGASYPAGTRSFDSTPCGRSAQDDKGVVARIATRRFRLGVPCPGSRRPPATDSRDQASRVILSAGAQPRSRRICDARDITSGGHEILRLRPLRRLRSG